jgi:hypothetical protein
MEFLDINLTKDSSLLFHAIHSPFYWRSIKKTYCSLVLNSLQKNPRNKKLESIHKQYFVKRKHEGRKPEKTCVCEKDSCLCPKKPRLMNCRQITTLYQYLIPIKLLVVILYNDIPVKGTIPTIQYINRSNKHQISVVLVITDHQSINLC